MFHDREINKKINRLQERALRIVYKDDTSSFQELLEKNNLVTIHHRNIHSLATEMYKVFNNLSNDVNQEIFPLRNCGYNFGYGIR